MSIQEELDIELERLTLRVTAKGLSNKLTAAALRYRAELLERTHVGDPKILEFAFPKRPKRW